MIELKRISQSAQYRSVCGGDSAASPFDRGVGAGVPVLPGEVACILICLLTLTFLSELYEQRVQLNCRPTAGGLGVFESPLDSSPVASALPSLEGSFGILFEQ